MATSSIRHSSRHRDESGIALLEVLVAIVIVTITATALLTLRLADLRAQARAQQLQTGLLLLQQHLDTVPLQPSHKAGETSGTFSAPHESVRWVQTLKATPFQSLWEITVRVSWPGTSAPLTLDATTYLHLGNGAT